MNPFEKQRAEQNKIGTLGSNGWELFELLQNSAGSTGLRDLSAETGVVPEREQIN